MEWIDSAGVGVRERKWFNLVLVLSECLDGWGTQGKGGYCRRCG